MDTALKANENAVFSLAFEKEKNPAFLLAQNLYPIILKSVSI